MVLQPERAVGRACVLRGSDFIIAGGLVATYDGTIIEWIDAVVNG